MGNNRNTAVGWAVLVGAVLVLLAGCINVTRASSKLGHLEPCDLLDAAERSALGVADGWATNQGALRTCSWQSADAGFGVWLHDANWRFDPSVPPHQSLLRIGSHEAGLYLDREEICWIQIDVGGDGELVQAEVHGGDPGQRCQRAERLAALIEPELP